MLSWVLIFDDQLPTLGVFLDGTPPYFFFDKVSHYILSSEISF